MKMDWRQGKGNRRLRKRESKQDQSGKRIGNRVRRLRRGNVGQGKVTGGKETEKSGQGREAGQGKRVRRQ